MEALTITPESFFWGLQTICGLHRKPFSRELVQQFVVPPYDIAAFSQVATQLGFDIQLRKRKPEKFRNASFPLIIWLAPTLGQDVSASPDDLTVGLVLQASATHVLLIEPTMETPVTIALDEFKLRYRGHAASVVPTADLATEGNSDESLIRRNFGFRWFIPELLKHKRLWQEILLASLIIQLIALATPLFTQAIIDKVVVHRTQSTLIVIAIGMSIFMLFSAALSWLRQYLVLHTGNRVDAVLGASVFEHLFKLPPQYFQHRPTGVIAARLHGVETIREFIASAAVTLILDLPFLLAFVAIMFYYSVALTLVVLALLSIIVLLSVLVAPLFQEKLQTQFQLGARNQAFLTEYIGGLETVKSLQLESHLNNRYSGYLASYLKAGFSTKQLANTYNTAANLLEQVMSLLILAIGAYTVMHSAEFTIGMLVAFQMFSGRLSQPMLRLVGLWQQFQQASLSIDRLGDLMNAPVEPYSVVPARTNQRKGDIRIDGVAFKYAEHLPFIYQGLSLTIAAGQIVAIMGPSGCGKSTLAKLLQGFYQPNAGRVLVDGVDIRYLSANELRGNFGVVPQETVLFSGTIYDNLQMASPLASFEQIVAACQMAEIHGVIEALPEGYQTQIGERGAGLSGGQRQRIAIARALLKRPSILVFDEATSALDTQTAEHFAHTVNALRGKVTMLFITHGLPRGLHVDAVYRLNPDGAQKVVAPAHIAATQNTASA
ncbi:peptidase domain-containing ABC transporter [Duganella sp. HH101]|uniref:peptidase domain-containing ABC transporter n=1 Tax=Duganella sp. HH101 TaxID=1781066 RepID=UPI000893F006|nr:peptidase domain-containing ABC transporter [Duganella sp. HH101]OFA00213.1 toxin RTX-I translocation ATP-binding protein [Duganella sp. HH101]